MPGEDIVEVRTSRAKAENLRRTRAIRAKGSGVGFGHVVDLVMHHRIPTGELVNSFLSAVGVKVDENDVGVFISPRPLDKQAMNLVVCPALLHKARSRAVKYLVCTIVTSCRVLTVDRGGGGRGASY